MKWLKEDEVRGAWIDFWGRLEALNTDTRGSDD